MIEDWLFHWLRKRHERRRQLASVQRILGLDAVNAQAFLDAVRKHQGMRPAAPEHKEPSPR